MLNKEIQKSFLFLYNSLFSTILYLAKYTFYRYTYNIKSFKLKYSLFFIIFFFVFRLYFSINFSFLFYKKDITFYYCFISTYIHHSTIFNNSVLTIHFLHAFTAPMDDSSLFGSNVFKLPKADPIHFK